MSEDGRLPRRDLWLLPLISLATIVILFLTAELAARAAYPEQEVDSCLVTDSRLGLKYRPNCHSRVKSFESDWAENRYNECGYRTDASCGPAPAGAFRVAVIGSSTALGFLMPQDQSFAAIARRDLAADCGRPVQFQNLAGFMIFWSRQLARIPDVLRLKPDAVLLEVAPLDLIVADPSPLATGEIVNTALDPAAPRSAASVFKEFLDRSRAFKVAQHFVFKDDSLYVSLYLGSKSKSAYMREPLDGFWQSQLEKYDRMLGQMADAFHRNGIPLVLAFVPHRAQSRIAMMAPPPPGIEPLLLDDTLRDMATRHGVGFVDVTRDFVESAQASPAEPLFFPVDGHLTAAGHAIAGDAIAEGLRRAIPALAECKTARIAGGSPVKTP